MCLSKEKPRNTVPEAVVQLCPATLMASKAVISELYEGNLWTNSLTIFSYSKGILYTCIFTYLRFSKYISLIKILYFCSRTLKILSRRKEPKYLTMRNT